MKTTQVGEGMEATKVTWAKAKKAILAAESVWFYSDGSLLLMTKVRVRGVEYEAYTQIDDYGPGWWVDICAPGVGTHRIAGYARLAFNSLFNSRGMANIGVLTLARPQSVRVRVDDVDTKSRLIGVASIVIWFCYADGAGITHEYLSETREECLYDVTTWGAYPIPTDIELQTGLSHTYMPPAYRTTERWTLKKKDEADK